jgi:myo-inositol-1(or 4)-monophosphatase
MLGDLHLHTRHSNGSLWPDEALVAAQGRGLDFVSFVDLNTTAGTERAIAIGLRLGITVIPGVEIAARNPADGREIHLLGYNFRLPAANIEAICRPLRDEPSKGQAPDALEAVRAIINDGGIAVLAHPALLDSWDAVSMLVHAGLRGIELYHPDHTPADEVRVRRLASEHDLIMTGGSNDRGLNDGNPAMGDICAPDGAFEALTRPADTEVAWAVDLAREAGAMARKAVAEEADVLLKGGDIKDLVTKHDIAIDRHLVAAIHERFPDHGFLTEEHDHPDIGERQPYWIIDPIDGTTNFVTRRDYFAISVAHYHGSQPHFGVVYDVMQDELYLGVDGEGAWLNGVRMPALELPGAMHDDGPGSRPEKPISECVIECSLNAAFELGRRYGASHEALARSFRATRSSGSAAIGICRVARDTLDVYLSSSLAVWDYAAAVIILREVGGDWTLVGRTADSASVSPDRGHSTKAPFLASRSPGLVARVEEILFPR